MKILMTITILMLFCFSSIDIGKSQSRPENTPNPTLTESESAQIDRIFAQWNKSDSPGCMIGIAQGGKQSLFRAYGMANLEHAIRLSSESISETGSVAKQFTAATIISLAQKGLLSLDDPVRKYLPEIPDFGEAITIRNLMNHTSGIRDSFGLLVLMGENPYNSVYATNERILELASRQKKLNFPPGTEYSYSNTAFTLLTQVVARVTGKSFADYTQENIFAPLGMKHTRWRNDFTLVMRNRAAAYEPDTTGFRTNLPLVNMHGSGGLLTTVGDLLLWNESIDNGKPEWRQVSDQLQIPSKLRDGRLIRYGLGLRVGHYRNIQEVSHSGSTAGYSTYLARYPRQQLSICLLCNTTNVNTTDLAHRVVDVVLGQQLAQTKTPEVKISKEERESKIGIYRNATSGLVIRVSVRNEKLVTGFGPFNDLIPITANKFIAAGGATEYMFEAQDGNASLLRIINAIDPDMPLVYQKVEQANPDQAKLAEYLGRYYSEELDATHQGSLQGGQLSLQVRVAPVRKLTPTFEDAFYESIIGYVVFIRDSNKKIVGYEVTSPDERCRRVYFSKRP